MSTILFLFFYYLSFFIFCSIIVNIGGDHMRFPVKIQKTKTNTTINIPSVIVKNLDLKKSQQVELEVKGNKIIIHIV